MVGVIRSWEDMGHRRTDDITTAPLAPAAP